MKKLLLSIIVLFLPVTAETGYFEGEKKISVRNCLEYFEKGKLLNSYINKYSISDTVERSDEYYEWMTIGWAFFNISRGSNDGYKLWTDFSRQCPDKFSETVCVYEWQKMVYKEDGLNMGTIIKYARDDNPEEFKKLSNARLEEHVEHSLNGTHHDIAQLMKNCSLEPSAGTSHFQPGCDFSPHRIQLSEQIVSYVKESHSEYSCQALFLKSLSLCFKSAYPISFGLNVN